eukprot:Nk52_evm55s1073 gene=Nk52_evmTU55s1073
MVYSRLGRRITTNVVLLGLLLLLEESYIIGVHAGPSVIINLEEDFKCTAIPNSFPITEWQKVVTDLVNDIYSFTVTTSSQKLETITISDPVDDSVPTENKMDEIFDKFYENNYAYRDITMVDRMSLYGAKQSKAPLSQSTISSLKANLKKSKELIYKTPKTYSPCSTLWYMYINCIRKCAQRPYNVFVGKEDRDYCSGVLKQLISEYEAEKRKCGSDYITQFNKLCDINTVFDYDKCKTE